MRESIFLKKKGQTGTEYLIIVAFVTFAIMVTVAIAYTVSYQTQSEIKNDQLEAFATKLVKSAESTFFLGEPSKSTIVLSLPEGVTNITIERNYVLFKMQLQSGENVRIFDSQVPLNGTLNTNPGNKKILLEAKSDYVLISDSS